MTAQCMTNHEQQFVQAYDQHADALFRFCYFRVYDRELAHDLVQESFTRCWDYLQQGHAVDNIRALLYRITRNVVIDYSRKKKETRLEPALAETVPDTAHTQHQLDTGVEAGMIIAAMAALDEQHREVLLLRYVEGYSPREIATLIEQSPNVVSVRIHRGLEQLKKLYDR